MNVIVPLAAPAVPPETGQSKNRAGKFSELGLSVTAARTALEVARSMVELRYAAINGVAMDRMGFVPIDEHFSRRISRQQSYLARQINVLDVFSYGQ